MGRVRDCTTRCQEKRKAAATLTLVLLLLVAITTVTITPAQTTRSTPHQYCSLSNSIRGSSSTASTYWARAYGGSGYDSVSSIHQTTDGGYIVAGTTESFGAGGHDAWVLKLNSTGSVEWQKTYGGSDGDGARSVEQTSDGGHIVAGGTRSFGAGGYDAWVLKLGTDGSVAWQKTYGRSGYDSANSIQQTTDGGYIVAGETDPSLRGGGYDAWVLKLNSTGSVEWQKVYFGWGLDSPTSVEQTADGGYIVAGSSTRPIYKGTERNYWVLGLDSGGSLVWKVNYEGDTYNGNSAQQTSDGGYIVAGGTLPSNVGPSLSTFQCEAWVLRAYFNGSVAWQKTYGGWGYDSASSVEQTADGGYIVAGETRSFGAGPDDVWVLKFNSAGSVEWQKTYGGGTYDRAISVRQTSDGGYILAGATDSFGAGGYDVWVVKLGVDGGIVWDAGSGASTLTTIVTPMDSDATWGSSMGSGSGDGAGAAQDTQAAPQDTNAIVTIQAGGQPTGEPSGVAIILLGVEAVAAYVATVIISYTRVLRKSRRQSEKPSRTEGEHQQDHRMPL